MRDHTIGCATNAEWESGGYMGCTCGADKENEMDRFEEDRKDNAEIAAKVMLAFAEGKPIEWKAKDGSSSKWKIATSPLWNWNWNYYREYQYPEVERFIKEIDKKHQLLTQDKGYEHAWTCVYYWCREHGMLDFEIAATAMDGKSGITTVLSYIRYLENDKQLGEDDVK